MRARRWWLAILVLLAAMAWQSQRALESGMPPTVPPSSTASDGAGAAASALNSTAPPPAVESAEPAADGATTSQPQAVLPSPAPPTLPTPTPAQAREWMRQRQREMECGTARRDNASEIRQTREWPWMPPERVAAERAAIAEARERLLQGCPPEIADEAERKRHWAQRQAELEAARRAGDLLARLSPVTIKTPEERNRARATLYDALLSGDPEAIAQIGRLQDYIQPAQIFDANPQAPASYVWPLVACDLGMDCGPGSRALDLACLSHGGGCGYQHLSESHRDWLPPWQYRLVERRRAELLARIRSGQIAGIFDPPGGKP